MRFYGTGALKAPHSDRVVWDFEDGPFDTDNPEIIASAKAQGFSTEAPAPAQPKKSGKAAPLPDAKAKGTK